LSTASIAVSEAFRYIFGAIATTGGSAQRGRYGLARILAHVTGTVDQELLARNEYLATSESISRPFSWCFRMRFSPSEPRSARLVIAYYLVVRAFLSGWIAERRGRSIELWCWMGFIFDWRYV
jgi:hypothetical protein